MIIDLDQLNLTMSDTEELVKSNNNLKHKIIYIAGFLERKYKDLISDDNSETDVEGDDQTSDFLTNLNRGGLAIPRISTVFFVHSSLRLFEKCKVHCCRGHLSQALSNIDSPLSNIRGLC